MILGRVKEYSVFPYEKLLLWVETLTSRFGIVPVLIDTVTLFVFYATQN